MTIRWRNIKGQPNYMISNDGVVLNKTSGQLSTGYIANDYYQFRFPNGKSVFTSRLVLDAFTKKPPSYKVCREKSSTDSSLECIRRGTMGEALRVAANRKNTVRGVSKWKLGNKKWRAAIHPGKGKTLTLGYFVKKKDALKAYHSKYIQLFGAAPFDLD